jgi:cytochrome c556
MKMIKKTFVVAAVIALGMSSLFAEDDKVKEQRLKVMHTYAGSLHMIQDGFLYNKRTKIVEGANVILETAQSVLKHDMKAHLPTNQAYTHKFAHKITERIVVHSETLLDALKRENPLEAMDEFNYLIKQCTSCHLRVRGW